MNHDWPLDAQFVLNDCKWLLSKYNVSWQNAQFRTSWFGIVSLLRAVGNVLEKCDSNKSEKHKIIISNKYEEIKKNKSANSIYWEFIKGERDRIVKEYKNGVIKEFISEGSGQNNEYVKISIDVGNQPLSVSSTGNGLPYIKDRISSQIGSGPFKGYSEINLANMAIVWWEDYLNDVVKQINE